MQSFSSSGAQEDSSESESEDSTEKSAPCKWHLGGRQVCRKAFAKLLGVGGNRLDRTRKRFRGLDERLLGGLLCLLSFNDGARK